MQKDQLLELRAKIVDSAQQIALNGAGSPAERLQVLLTIIRDGAASLDILTRAYELSQQVDAEEDKLNVMLDLLYEVDSQLSNLNPTDESVSPPLQEVQGDEGTSLTDGDQ